MTIQSIANALDDGYKVRMQLVEESAVQMPQGCEAMRILG